MSMRPDPDLVIAAWLGDEAREGAPARLLTATRQQIESTHQRRAWWPARRSDQMNGYMKITIAAAAVIVVVLVGINLLPRSGGLGGPAPTASPTPTSTVSPTPIPAPTPSATSAALPDGPLQAGTYTIAPFVGDNAMGLCFVPPQVGCTESAADDSIRVTFTVPDGWTRFGGTVVPAVESYPPPGGAGLMISRGGWVWSDLCNSAGQPDTPTGTTVNEFVTALVNHPDLDVKSPVDVTLAGYSGRYLEIQMPANVAVEGRSPGPGETCGSFVWEPGIYAQGPSQLWHIWVLDVNGVRVVIRSDTFPGTTPKVQTELQAIVGSIKIET